MIKLYNHYQKGFLASDFGLENTAFYLDCMSFIDNEINKSGSNNDG